MSAPADAYVEAAIRRFDEGLNRAGLRTVACGDSAGEWQWRGSVGRGREPVVVGIGEDFPFSAPWVILPRRADRTDWHQMPNGLLCLWDRHSQGSQPWLDGLGLVDRIEEWVAESNAGWADDMPQLDLEAYHDIWQVNQGGRSFVPLLIVEEWDQIAGGWFRTTLPDGNGMLKVTRAQLPVPAPATQPQRSPRRPSKKSTRVRPDKFFNGLAVDLGDIAEPFLTRQLAEKVGVNVPSVKALVEAGRPVVIVARYSRRQSAGLIGFWLEAQGEGYFPVAERRAAQERRTGWHADSIADRKVVVIGAGSIGSYLADLLHRSGVTQLKVHDSDILLPGNLARHAASPAFVGASKTQAVQETAAQRDPDRPIQIAPAVRGLADAVELLRDQDLVVDCTGDRLTWQLLIAAADIAATSFLHVTVIGHGQVGRVDVCPPLDGADPLQEDPVQPFAGSEWEGGCGDPVSPTPPAAVVETAAMGARFAIRMLAGEPVSPAGESRELFPHLP